mmetsp:Transcript_167889/g.533908  ORF Transcript_167889/g.533908 Transcript_167889/m.533908 type:complete len:89 (+) Transcript_167889:54-320(+)
MAQQGVAQPDAAAAAADGGAPALNLPAHYVVGKLLGQGAYGQVYLCRDERNGTEVAIKVVRDLRPTCFLANEFFARSGFWRPCATRTC